VGKEDEDVELGEEDEVGAAEDGDDVGAAEVGDLDEEDEDGDKPDVRADEGGAALRLAADINDTGPELNRIAEKEIMITHYLILFSITCFYLSMLIYNVLVTNETKLVMILAFWDAATLSFSLIRPVTTTRFLSDVYYFTFFINCLMKLLLDII
jgi:hypothetical protein